MRFRDMRLSAKKRKKANRNKHKCFYCGVKKKKLTKDHVHPKSKGGKQTVPCCYNCNQRKRNMLFSEWQEYMKDKQKFKV